MFGGKYFADQILEKVHGTNLACFKMGGFAALLKVLELVQKGVSFEDASDLVKKELVEMTSIPPLY